MAGALLAYLVGAYLAMPLLWTRYARRHPALEDIPGVTRTADGTAGDPLNVTDSVLNELAPAARGTIVTAFEPVPGSALGEVAATWAHYDVILSPTLAQPPAILGSLRDDADPSGDFEAQTRFTPWTSVFNLTGRPAISLPLHTVRLDGPQSPELPIGVMLGGRFGADSLLLSLAAALEAVAPWGRPAA